MIGEKLNSDVEVVAIGGTALVLRDLKPSTIDVDIATLSNDDFEKVIEAAYASGYRELWKASWVRVTNEVPIDVFPRRVGEYLIGGSMVKRSRELFFKLSRLTLNVLHPQDILLLKSLMGRETKDFEDMKTIIKCASINWRDVIAEVKWQLDNGGSTRIVLELGYWLEHFKQREKLGVPEWTINELWLLLQKL